MDNIVLYPETNEENIMLKQFWSRNEGNKKEFCKHGFTHCLDEGTFSTMNFGYRDGDGIPRQHDNDSRDVEIRSLKNQLQENEKTFKALIEGYGNEELICKLEMSKGEILKYCREELLRRLNDRNEYDYDED